MRGAATRQQAKQRLDKSFKVSHGQVVGVGGRGGGVGKERAASR